MPSHRVAWCCINLRFLKWLSYSFCKASSGFVCAITNASQKATTGGMLMAIQSFYPSGRCVNHHWFITILFIITSSLLSQTSSPWLLAQSCSFFSSWHCPSTINHFATYSREAEIWNVVFEWLDVIGWCLCPSHVPIHYVSTQQQTSHSCADANVLQLSWMPCRQLYMPCSFACDNSWKLDLDSPLCTFWIGIHNFPLF